MITLTTPIYFNGTDLNSIAGWITTGTDTFRYPNRKVNNFSISSSNNSVTTAAWFESRPINIRGTIRVYGRENLDDSIGELRRILEPINKVLQLPVSGCQRKFNNVTVKNVAITDVAGGMAMIDIEFITSDPFNYSLTTTQVLNISNLTTTPKQYAVTFDGSTSQLPIITCTYDSLTGSTNCGVTLTNMGDSKSITISRIWSAYDVLQIDCQNKTVKVNGTSVEFTGNFLSFNKGLGYIQYSDTLTARQVDINIIYTKRFS